MNRMRKALAAAAVLVVMPAVAHAQDVDERHHDRADRPDRGDRGDRGSRQAGPARDAGRPQAPAMPQVQAAPAAPRPGGGYAFGRPGGSGDQRSQWQGNRGNWGGNNGDRADARSMPPQAVPAQNWQQRAQERGQWRGDGRVGDDRAVQNDVRRDGDRRWDGRQWNTDDRRGDNDRRRWDNNDRRGNGNDHRWDGNRGFRHDPNWRNDRRYDWRGWRDSHRDLFRWRYAAPRGYSYRTLYRGFYLEPFFYGSSYWLADPYEYRLPPVEWPLRWVRYYDDAVLVDVTTGEVVDVIQSFFF